MITIYVFLRGSLLHLGMDESVYLLSLSVVKSFQYIFIVLCNMLYEMFCYVLSVG